MSIVQQKILVIIPTYNEAENIESMIFALLGVATEMPRYCLDILIVDDNSPDGTSKIVQKLKRKHTNIHMIKGQKEGLGKAYLRGFRSGLRPNNNYFAFIMMDADFSHNPATIPAMIQKLDAHNDYVIGSRYIHGGTIPGNWPMLRILNSKVANFVAHSLIGIDKNVTDITGGFKAIRVSALASLDLSSIKSAGYFFQVNLVHLFIDNGFKVAEVPIAFLDRQFGVSKMKLKDIIEFVRCSYQLNPNSRFRQLVRFLTVGATGTIVNLLAITVLIHIFNLSAIISDMLAIEISIISNFFMNHHYTFKYSKHADGSSNMFFKLIKFNLGAIGGALISIGMFTLLYRYGGLHYLAADLIGIIVSTGWNFWISTRYVWKTVDAGA